MYLFGNWEKVLVLSCYRSFSHTHNDFSFLQIHILGTYYLLLHFFRNDLTLKIELEIEKFSQGTIFHFHYISDSSPLAFKTSFCQLLTLEYYECTLKKTFQVKFGSFLVTFISQYHILVLYKISCPRILLTSYMLIQSFRENIPLSKISTKYVMIFQCLMKILIE